MNGNTIHAESSRFENNVWVPYNINVEIQYNNSEDYILVYGSVINVEYTLIAVTGIADELQKAGSFKLTQNYPNPFNPSTVISYELPVNSQVQLKIYDIHGQEIVTLVNEAKPKGNYEIKFDASDLSSGVYFYQLKANGVFLRKKMLLLK